MYLIILHSISYDCKGMLMYASSATLLNNKGFGGGGFIKRGNSDVLIYIIYQFLISVNPKHNIKHLLKYLSCQTSHIVYIFCSPY